MAASPQPAPEPSGSPADAVPAPGPPERRLLGRLPGHDLVLAGLVRYTLLRARRERLGEAPEPAGTALGSSPGAAACGVVMLRATPPTSLLWMAAAILTTTGPPSSAWAPPTELALDPPEQPGKNRFADPGAVHEDYGAHARACSILAAWQAWRWYIRP